MKKQNVSLLTFLLATSSFLFSCIDITNKNTGALKFDSIQVNKTAHLFGDTAKPACNLVINLAYATQATKTELKDSVNSYLLAVCLGNQYIGMAPQKAVGQYVEQYINDYRNDLESIYEKDEQESTDYNNIEAWYSYYKNLSSRIQFYHKNLLVYSYHYEEYTGGAHGIYMTSYLNLDLQTLIPIRLDDIFVGDYRESLTDLLWNQLMLDNNVTSRQELEELGYVTDNELEPTENFYLDHNGITFYYNVYEIAPYVMGPVKITIPYDVLEHLLGEGTNIVNELRY